MALKDLLWVMGGKLVEGILSYNPIKENSKSISQEIKEAKRFQRNINIALDIKIKELEELK
jgi:hypothetical protein